MRHGRRFRTRCFVFGTPECLTASTQERLFLSVFRTGSCNYVVPAASLNSIGIYMALSLEGDDAVGKKYISDGQNRRFTVDVIAFEDSYLAAVNNKSVLERQPNSFP